MLFLLLATCLMAQADGPEDDRFEFTVGVPVNIQEVFRISCPNTAPAEGKRRLHYWLQPLEMCSEGKFVVAGVDRWHRFGPTKADSRGPIVRECVESVLILDLMNGSVECLRLRGARSSQADMCMLLGPTRWTDGSFGVLAGPRLVKSEDITPTYQRPDTSLYCGEHNELVHVEATTKSVRRVGAPAPIGELAAALGREWLIQCGVVADEPECRDLIFTNPVTNEEFRARIWIDCEHRYVKKYLAANNHDSPNQDHTPVAVEESAEGVHTFCSSDEPDAFLQFVQLDSGKWIVRKCGLNGRIAWSFSTDEFATRCGGTLHDLQFCEGASYGIKDLPIVALIDNEPFQLRTIHCSTGEISRPISFQMSTSELNMPEQLCISHDGRMLVALYHSDEEIGSPYVLNIWDRTSDSRELVRVPYSSGLIGVAFDKSIVLSGSDLDEALYLLRPPYTLEPECIFRLCPKLDEDP